MKPSFLSLLAATALLTATIFAAATVAQAPQAHQATPPVAASHPDEDEHELAHPAPTNLKVLPKNLTGDQVHEIMEGWEAALGVHCSACHVPDPNNIGPNGRPRLNYAADGKEEKSTARIMVTMVEDINRNYVAAIESSGVPVTCGTCHRGHLGPEPWVAPERSRPPSLTGQKPRLPR